MTGLYVNSADGDLPLAAAVQWLCLHLMLA